MVKTVRDGATSPDTSFSCNKYKLTRTNKDDDHTRVIARRDWASLAERSRTGARTQHSRHTGSHLSDTLPPLQTLTSVWLRVHAISNCKSKLSTESFPASRRRQHRPTSPGLALPPNWTTLTFPSPSSCWIKSSLSATCRIFPRPRHETKDLKAALSKQLDQVVIARQAQVNKHQLNQAVHHGAQLHRHCGQSDDFLALVTTASSTVFLRNWPLDLLTPVGSRDNLRLGRSLHSLPGELSHHPLSPYRKMTMFHHLQLPVAGLRISKVQSFT